jgi:hypothetical protein
MYVQKGIVWSIVPHCLSFGEYGCSVHIWAPVGTTKLHTTGWIICWKLFWSEGFQISLAKPWMHFSPNLSISGGALLRWIIPPYTTVRKGPVQKIWRVRLILDHHKVVYIGGIGVLLDVVSLWHKRNMCFFISNIFHFPPVIWPILFQTSNTTWKTGFGNGRRSVTNKPRKVTGRCPLLIRHIRNGH